MQNKYFPEEEITEDDLYFMSYMIERVARKLKHRNKYVVNQIGKDELYHLISCATVLHCENPLQVEADWIRDYSLGSGEFDITNVDPELAELRLKWVQCIEGLSWIQCLPQKTMWMGLCGCTMTLFARSLTTTMRVHSMSRHM